MSTDSLRTTLRSRGQSLTHTRRVVYAALQGQEPLTMHELVTRCPSVNRSSVYRTVTLFERLGIVQRLQTGWKHKLELSDQFHDHHHHATCLHCGRAEVITEDIDLEAYLHQLAASIGFQVERHQLELQGWCARCRAETAGQPLKKVR